jgi:hypothetical protein
MLLYVMASLRRSLRALSRTAEVLMMFAAARVSSRSRNDLGSLHRPASSQMVRRVLPLLAVVVG